MALRILVFWLFNSQTNTPFCKYSLFQHFVLEANKMCYASSTLIGLLVPQRLIVDIDMKDC